MHRFSIISLAFVLFAAACGELPLPFEHRQQKAAYPLAELAVEVRVLPLSGLLKHRGRALARAVAINLGAHGFTATFGNTGASRFILQGSVEKAFDVSQDGATLLIHWSLRERNGEPVGLHVQELQTVWADWGPPDAGDVMAFGAPPAKAIAGLIEVDAELPPGAMATGRTGIFVQGVTGAPGDGNNSLAAAMRRALAIRSIATADTATTAAHILRATVKADAPSADQQSIAIVWRLDNPKGELLGEAAQQNTIEAGSLNAKWGPVAGYAAAAAVDGIEEILARKKGNETGGRTIILPPNSNLVPPEAPKTAPPAKPRQ